MFVLIAAGAVVALFIVVFVGGVLALVTGDVR